MTKTKVVWKDPPPFLCPNPNLLLDPDRRLGVGSLGGAPNLRWRCPSYEKGTFLITNVHEKYCSISTIKSQEIIPSN